jgi:hypothetical protein
MKKSPLIILSLTVLLDPIGGPVTFHQIQP